MRSLQHHLSKTYFYRPRYTVYISLNVSCLFNYLQFPGVPFWNIWAIPNNIPATKENGIITLCCRGEFVQDTILDIGFDVRNGESRVNKVNVIIYHKEEPAIAEQSGRHDDLDIWFIDR